MSHRTRLVGLVFGWAWLAGCIALLAVQLINLRHGDRAGERPRPAQQVNVALTPHQDPRLVAFLQFARATPGGGAPAMSLDHAYTASGLRRLADALDAVDSSNDVSDALRQAATRIGANPRSLRHADSVHDAFDAALHVLDTGRVRGATTPVCTNGIVANRPLLDQRQEVRAFFACVATRLQRPIESNDDAD